MLPEMLGLALGAASAAEHLGRRQKSVLTTQSRHPHRRARIIGCRARRDYPSIIFPLRGLFGL